MYRHQRGRHCGDPVGGGMPFAFGPGFGQGGMPFAFHARGHRAGEPGINNIELPLPLIKVKIHHYEETHVL